MTSDVVFFSDLNGFHDLPEGLFEPIPGCLVGGCDFHPRALVGPLRGARTWWSQWFVWWAIVLSCSDDSHEVFFDHKTHGFCITTVGILNIMTSYT